MRGWSYDPAWCTQKDAWEQNERIRCAKKCLVCPEHRLSATIVMSLTCNFLCQRYQCIWDEVTIVLTCQMLIYAPLSLSQAADVQKLLVLILKILQSLSSFIQYQKIIWFPYHRPLTFQMLPADWIFKQVCW